MVPVECHDQFVEVLKNEAKKADLLQRKLSSDVNKAVAIIVKSFTVFDKLAQDVCMAVKTH